MTASEDYVEVPTRTFVKGKWVIDAKRVPTAECDPEDTTEEKADNKR